MLADLASCDDCSSTGDLLMEPATALIALLLKIDALCFCIVCIMTCINPDKWRDYIICGLKTCINISGTIAFVGSFFYLLMLCLR